MKKITVSLIAESAIRLEPKAAKKPRVEWNEAEVAKRALEVFDLENAVKRANFHMIDRANDFKESRGLEHVSHDDPTFRRYSAKALAAVIAAKAEVRKARARLQTACRNCQRVRVPRLKTPTPRVSKRTVARLFGE
ncbi:hypothetical protein AB4Y45_27845 [Paraburkholderia sp. EG287A]|uniref:hypothetical protein n=1 Tax=Paraburkholderia sp. EG287A TaxID=3237012 RepID=UPI0034D2B6D5